MKMLTPSLRRRARIARRRPQDRDRLPSRSNLTLIKIPQELEREILERQGWTMKQLENPHVVGQFDHGSNFFVIKL